MLWVDAGHRVLWVLLEPKGASGQKEPQGALGQKEPQGLLAVLEPMQHPLAGLRLEL